MKKIVSLCIGFIFLSVILPISFAAAEESVSGEEQRIYFEKDFDDPYFDPFDNTTLRPTVNNIYTEEKDGNRYMVFEKVELGEANNSVTFEKILQVGTQEKKMILQFDISADAFETSVSMLVTDSSQEREHLFTIAKDSIGGKQVLSTDGWTTIAAVYDFTSGTVTVYAGGEEALKLTDLTFRNFWRLRVVTYPGQPAGKFYFDNFYIYSGDTPLSKEELANLEYATYVKTEYEEIKENTEALTIYGDYFIDGKKGKDESLVLQENNELLVSQEGLAELYGETASGGYVPFAEAFERIGKTAVYDERGFLYWAEDGSELTLSDGESRVLYSYLAYERPESEYLKANIKKSHPRISIEEGRIEEIKKEIETNEYAKGYYDRSFSLLNEYYKAPVVSYPSEGSMLLTSREVLDRVSSLALHYLITENEEEKANYKTKLWQELETVCGESFPDWRPSDCLSNGEMAAAVACAYDWLYDDWDDGQKEILEEALYEKAVKYAVKAYGGWMDSDHSWWVNTGKNNQNAVANGGYIMMCLALMDKYPEEASWVLEKAIRSMESYQNSFYPGGSWSESVTYWTYAMKYWTPAVRSLQISYGTDFGMSHAPDIEKSTEFVLYASSLKKANNFHDGGDNNPIYYIGSFYGLAKIFGRSELANIKLTYDTNTPVRGGLGVLLDFPEEAKVGEINLAKDAAFYKDGLVSFRESWEDANSMYFSYHGGEGFPGHGHIDTGTFVYDYWGERFAVDLGTEDYGLEGKVGDTSDLYRIRPEGHNCLVINPDETAGQDKEAFSPIEAYGANENGSYSIINMSESYGAYAQSVRRGAKTADNRNSVIIRDEITSLKQKSDIYWFMHTKAAVELLDDGKSAVLTQNGKSIKFELVTDAESFELKVMEAKPMETSPQIEGQTDNSAYRKLAVVIKAGAGDGVYIQVKLSPVSDDMPETQNVPLDNWEADELGKIYLESEEGENSVIRGEVGRKNVFAAIAAYKDNKLESISLASDNSYDGMTAKCSLEKRKDYEIKLIMWESAELVKPIRETLPFKE